MPRGGYRRPAQPAPASPPGANSRRTDTGPRTAQNTARSKQPIRTPRISDTVGSVTSGAPLQQGDVQRLEEAQRQQGLPVAQGPVAPGQARAEALGVKPGEDFLYRESDRPFEPIDLDAPILSQGPDLSGPVGRLAFKVDVLRELSTLPFASQHIQVLLQQADAELRSAMRGPNVTPPPPGPLEPAYSPQTVEETRDSDMFAPLPPEAQAEPGDAYVPGAPPAEAPTAPPAPVSEEAVGEPVPE